MNAGWFNLILFLVLAGVIILCSFNIATYSDIKNGNTNAPDITDGECTAMIVINTILLVTAVLTLIYYIYQVYKGAVQIFENKEYAVEGKTVFRIFNQESRPNKPMTQLFLWLFATFAFIVSLFNLINATKINNSDANNAVSSSGAFLAFSWIIMFIALGYFLYTTFRTLLPKELERVSLFGLGSIFSKTLTTKPTIPTLIPGECKGKVNMKDFNKYLADTLHLPGDKPFSVLDNIRINY
jgi:hypothetical protein